MAKVYIGLRNRQSGEVTNTAELERCVWEEFAQQCKENHVSPSKALLKLMDAAVKEKKQKRITDYE